MKGGERLNLLIISDDNKVYTLYSMFRASRFGLPQQGVFAPFAGYLHRFRAFWGYCALFTYESPLSASQPLDESV